MIPEMACHDRDITANTRGQGKIRLACCDYYARYGEIVDRYVVYQSLGRFWVESLSV